MVVILQGCLLTAGAGMSSTRWKTIAEWQQDKVGNLACHLSRSSDKEQEMLKHIVLRCLFKI